MFADRLSRSPWRLATGATLLVIVLMTIGLRLEGRRWSADADGFVLFVASPDSPETSQRLADPYTFTHLLHRVALFWPLMWAARRWPPTRGVRSGGVAAVTAAACAALEAAWEVLENSPLVIARYRANTASLGYTGDTIVNSLGDLAACLAGFLLAWKIGPKASAVVFVATELALLIAIRDGLFLSVLMLIVPLEGLRDWQAGR